MDLSIKNKGHARNEPEETTLGHAPCNMDPSVYKPYQCCDCSFTLALVQIVYCISLQSLVPNYNWIV